MHGVAGSVPTGSIVGSGTSCPVVLSRISSVHRESLSDPEIPPGKQENFCQLKGLVRNGDEGRLLLQRFSV